MEVGRSVSAVRCEVRSHLRAVRLKPVVQRRLLHEMSITSATANMTDCGRTTPGAGEKVSFLMITLRGRRLKILKSAGFGSGFVAVGDPLAGRS